MERLAKQSINAMVEDCFPEWERSKRLSNSAIVNLVLEANGGKEGETESLIFYGGDRQKV